MLADPLGHDAEAFRVLRASFDYANADYQARTIMVTSAVGGEGKSTTVANLAVALARAAEVRDPSLILILSDINMPGMSGLEMLPKVRAQRPDVPVIMITAYGDAETRRKAIERGAVGLLTKPIDFALLRHEIDTRLGRAA